MPRHAPALAFAALVLLPRASFAAGFPDASYKALPCRPTIACTADLVPPGALELEVGFLRRKQPGTVVQTVPALFKLSLSEVVQLQIGSNTVLALADGRARSVDDLYGGAKVRVLTQDAGRPAIAFSLAADGTHVAERGATAYGGLFIAYATKDTGALHWDLNLGANTWRLTDETHAQAWAALALSSELPKGLGVMLEGYAFSSAVPVAPKDAGVLAALTFSPTPFLTFDAGGDVALFPSSRAFSLFVGMTVITIDLWDETPARAPALSPWARKLAHAADRETLGP